MSDAPYAIRDVGGKMLIFRSEREAKRYEMTHNPEWLAEQEAKDIILKLRFILGALKVVKLSESSFDSNDFIAKYKKNQNGQRLNVNRVP